MAIKFNHVTNTISFTSGACSSSFVDSSATGIFETTGYARNCYVTTGQTGNFVTASQTGCFITTGQTGAFGGGGGGTSLPNGTTENSALCWNGSAWVAAQTYVATGQTGNFSPYNLNFNNFNVTYKCNSNSISNSTGSAILEGACNCIDSNLYSQINNGCCNYIAVTGVTGSCHNYIENGFRNYIYNSNFSEILNGTCSVISGAASHSAIINGSGNCIRGGTAMTIVNSMCSNICGGGTFSSVILGGCTNVINSASRSSIIGGNANIICSASVDAVINGGRSHCIIGASMSTIVGGNSNRILNTSAIASTGNVIIGGEQSRICGCNTNCNTIINSFSGCIASGSFNTLINGANSCLIAVASSSLIIGPCNVISGFTGAVVIGSGITANANNTLFVSNLRSTGIISGNSICGTGNFVTTSQTGAFAPAAGTGIFVTTAQTGSFSYVRCPSSPTVGCVICYDGSNWVAGTSAGGGGGTTLPNGTSANSALCWNGSAWTTGQTYVATGATGNFINTSQTGEFETTGYARRCYVTTGQTGNFGGGGTTLPNGTVANSAICWNGSAWTTGQSYETTGYARRCYVTTGQTGNFLTTAEVQTGNFALLNPTPISTTSTNYTLGLSDNGKPIIFNTNVVTSLFVPLNSAISFPSGAQLTIFQKGTGIVNITGNAGVSILSNGNRYNLVGQYSMASLIKITTNEWALGGDLTV